MPLPPITMWYQALHTPYTNSLSMLAFYPTFLTSIYLWRLLGGGYSVAECHARFGLAALGCFIFVVCYLTLGVLALVLPFIMGSGRMLPSPPPTPLLQQAVWIGFILLCVLNIAVLIQGLFNFYRFPHTRENLN